MEQHHPKSKLWPGMIFALIGLNFTVVGVTIYAASAHASSHAVEPDYDRKALNWDKTARQAAHNQALGWSIQITGISAGAITVSLRDRNGLSLDNAEIFLEAFHHAHAADMLTARLTPATDGYRAALAIGEPGLWEFRFNTRRAGETWTTAITRIVTEPGP